jgi:hypothetical protein
MFKSSKPYNMHKLKLFLIFQVKLSFQPTVAYFEVNFWFLGELIYSYRHIGESAIVIDANLFLHLKIDFFLILNIPEVYSLVEKWIAT